MIKYKETLLKSSTGISGIGNLFVALNSGFLLLIVRLFKIKESAFVCHVLWVMTFLLIFAELYTIHSLAIGMFYLSYKRASMILLWTVIVYFFGRHSLPHYYEGEEEQCSDKAKSE